MRRLASLLVSCAAAWLALAPGAQATPTGVAVPEPGIAALLGAGLVLLSVAGGPRA